MSASKNLRRTTTTYTTSSSGGRTSAASTYGASSRQQETASASGWSSGGALDVSVDDASGEETRVSGKSGGGSPLSPTRLTRQQEKAQLSHLNDRLAQYIDRVRSLETENQRLSLQIRNSEEIVVRERNNIRAAFEAELADARRLLDETAREKARLQIEAGKFKALVDELQSRINKLERDLKDSETRRLYVESQVQDLQGKLNTADSQRKHWEDEAKKLRLENHDLRKQLDNAQKQLEDETVNRVDLENRLQSLREELAFNKNLYDQELDETRRKRQVELTEINQELEEEYKAKLQDALREMREQLDITIRMNRKEIEEMYENKMQEMRDMADRNREAAATAREELKRVRYQLEQLEGSHKDYDAKLAAAERKVKELQDALRGAESDFYSRLHMREEEIRRLQDEIARMMQEYQDLMDTKIQLDVEIEAYRRLLESEESRLHLSATASPASSVASSSSRSMTADKRGVKRKRFVEERETAEHNTFETKHGAIGDVEISDHHLDGSFVKISNRSDKDIPVGGYVLKREAGGHEVTYKFHPKLILKGLKTLTVYSSNTDATHSPPDILVMKNQQWPTGDRIRTTLINSDDEEIAWRESNRSSSSKRTSYRTSGGPSGTASVYNVDDPDADQRCAVM